MQWLNKWVCRWSKTISRDGRRLQVYKICMLRVAEAVFAHCHLMLPICDYMSRNGSCLQRDDWKSVALPLQSYRSTAAGVSSSAPPHCSLPDYFHPLLLCPIEKLPVATCWRSWEMHPLTTNPPTFHTLLFPLTCLCSVINITPSCPPGIPILTIAITIPSCSSRPCWPAMSHSHPTRR